MAQITGTPEDDDLSSSNEGDEILGLGGSDVLAANAANITLNGGPGDDQLFSFVGDSILIGGPGMDFLLGLGANETASYSGASAGVSVDLSSEMASDDGDSGFDFLFGIENVTGSAFNDILIGDDLANVLQGGAGNDTITGNGGADVFKYSFDFTQGGGETFSFTEFFAARGGTVVNGEVADGTKQGQFSSLYTQWLESIGLTVLDLGQNSGSGGMPVVEGPNGTFGERESFTWTSGGGKKTVTHERWYSDTWSSGGAEDAVASNDGLDNILDFGAGDQLNFIGITQEQFLEFFSVDSSQDVDGDDSADTVITIEGSSDWSLTLSGVTTDLLTVASESVFS